MTDPKLEAAARELLATACGERVEDMLYDRPGFVAKDQAIRAIVAALSQQRAVPEGYALVSTSQLDRWEKAAGEVADYMSRAKVSRHIYAQSELLAAEIHFELAAAPSPEQEK